MKKIKFGLSPCPNDTFIFYNFLKRTNIESFFLDVEELNQKALKEEFPLIKASCYTAVKLKNYIILKSGGAIGYGCGPILVSNQKHENFIYQFKKSKILIPGENTTANFLFSYFCKNNSIPIDGLSVEFIRYDKIIPSLQTKNEPMMGILIHEERFTYQKFNLKLILDLGEWWEKKTNLPIPLGCIVLHKDLAKMKEEIENDIQKSILYSRNHFDEVFPFIKEHAQTLEEKAILAHIKLYVTDFSYDMMDKGYQTLDKMKSFILNL